MLDLCRCANRLQERSREENQGVTMFHKTIIAVGVGALVCGLCIGSASAKQRHHVRHVAAAPTAQKMSPMPGNNPMAVLASSETDRSQHPAPKAYIGNNPMAVPAK
jgi:hypothetical protein